MFFSCLVQLTSSPILTAKDVSAFTDMFVDRSARCPSQVSGTRSVRTPRYNQRSLLPPPPPSHTQPHHTESGCSPG